MSQRKNINYEPDYQKHPLHNIVLEQDDFIQPTKGQIRYNGILNTIGWHTGIVEKTIYDIKLNELALPINSIDLNNNKIIHVATPQNPDEATNKSYVDTAISNISQIANPSYLHTQNTDQYIWNINHNLNKKPHIDFYDQYGLLFIAYYYHIDNNNSQAVLNLPTKGTAQCSI